MAKQILLKENGHYLCNRVRQFDWLVSCGFYPLTQYKDSKGRDVWVFQIDESLVKSLNAYIANSQRQGFIGDPIAYVLSNA